MPNGIIVLHGQTVHEFTSIREVLDWAIIEITGTSRLKGQAKEPSKDNSKGAKALETILAPTPKETPKEEVKGTNSFDLPPMRKPFFGGKDKGEMLSFSYTINGEIPRAKPADTSRILFTKTAAYLQMPPKERDKVVTWGLSFLKKQVRESGKVASCETTMAETYSIDRFAFLKGAKVVFRVGIKSIE